MRTGPNGELLSNNGKQLDFNKIIYDDDFDKASVLSLLQKIYYNPASAQQEITQWIQSSDRGSSSPEQIQDLEKEFGTQGDNNDTGTSYQSREDVPESARDLWDIMHNDEAINSMRRGV